MSEVKMSDLLDLPYGRVSKTIFGDKSANNLLSLIDGTQYQVEYICTAINSYDSNQELIVKQAAQIKLLREALESAKRGLAHSNYQFVKECVQLADKALEATKE